MRALWMTGLALLAAKASADPAIATSTTAEPPAEEEPAPPEEEAAPPEEEEEAAQWQSKGELAIESRGFLDDGRASTQDYNLGLFARLEAEHEYGVFTERVRLFGRLDAFDDARSTFVVEEAWAQVKWGSFRVRAGLDLINWTATEAFHPVDVINARNLDGDLENLEKIGEPMVSAQLSLPTQTSVEVYLMPGYLGPRYPSPQTRQSIVPPGIVLGERVLFDREGARTDAVIGPQAAVRVRQTIGNADLSLHAIEHMDRSQPDFVFDPSVDLVRPVALTVRQLGGTYQHVFDALIVKIEAAYRSFETPSPAALAGLVPLTTTLADRDHFTFAVGLEYGLVHESGPESTLIAEVQYLVGPSEEARAFLSPFQQDVLLGYRLALGDADSKELLVTGLFDASGRAEAQVGVSYSQRIGEVWGIKAGARAVFTREVPLDPRGGARYPTGLEALRDADLIRITLTRYF